jgi:hypothetical protein
MKNNHWKILIAWTGLTYLSTVSTGMFIRLGSLTYHSSSTARSVCTCWDSFVHAHSATNMQSLPSQRVPKKTNRRNWKKTRNRTRVGPTDNLRFHLHNFLYIIFVSLSSSFSASSERAAEKISKWKFCYLWEREKWKEPLRIKLAQCLSAGEERGCQAGRIILGMKRRDKKTSLCVNNDQLQQNSHSAQLNLLVFEVVGYRPLSKTNPNKAKLVVKTRPIWTTTRI